MGHSNADPAQHTEPLDLDVVAELEQIIQRIGHNNGLVNLDVVFADGHYIRGFTKRGPLSADQMRELAADREHPAT